MKKLGNKILRNLVIDLKMELSEYVFLAIESYSK